MTEVVIPVRALEHYSYCKRQAALIHVDGVWRDNAHTVRGVRGHERVDSAPSRRERGRQVLRGVSLWSERLGLTGRADTVEVMVDGSIEPVEYKIGTRHGRNAEVQLCAQALCLEEMLDVEIGVGHVWYAGPRRRDRVPIDADLRRLTESAIVEIRSWFEVERLPAAANDERCNECQLLGYCMPDLVAEPERVLSYVNREVLGCA